MIYEDSGFWVYYVSADCAVKAKFCLSWKLALNRGSPKENLKNKAGNYC